MPWKVFGKCLHKLNADGSKGELVKCHATPAEADAHMRAMYANVPESENPTSAIYLQLLERDFSTEQRRMMADKGTAMADGSYPITNEQDLHNAIQAFGRAKDKAATKRHIMKRAKAMGMMDALPEDWKESAHTHWFAQLADLHESQLDAAGFTVKGVTLIKPGFSANVDRAGRPRYYPAATLKAAARHFEGVRAYINHPSKTQATDLPERDVRDLAGYYENVKAADDGRLIGDLRVVGAAQATIWPQIVETVERKPGYVDLSINALGTTKIGEAEGKPAVVVESIVGANSVDIVTTGAAGGSFAGALLASDGGETFTRQLLDALTFEEWREARPEYLDKLKLEWKTTRDDSALKDARAEIETLKNNAAVLAEQHRAEGAELAEYRRGALADRLLEASKLPFALRGTVRGQLLAEADEAGMRAVLEREVAKYAAAPRPPVPVHGAGQRTSAPPPETPGAPANPVAEALGLNARFAPKDGESPEQWAQRTKQLRGN